MNFNRFNRFCLLPFALMVACGPGTEAEQPRQEQEETLTKEEARDRLSGKADDTLSFDICAKSGWYDDGVCDDFCDLPDPDCGSDTRVCEQFVGEAPVCPPGSVEVGVCDGGECEEVFGTGDRCDESILCYSSPFACPQVIGSSPSCPAGSKEVTRCESDDCAVVAGTGDRCDEFVLCEANDDNDGGTICPQVVGAPPQCNSDEVRVPACPEGRSCREVSGTGDRCDETGICMETPDFCPAVVGTPAECPAGTREVAMCSTSQCSVEVGDGDQCDDVALCEPGTPRRVSGTAELGSGVAPTRQNLQGVGMAWVAYDSIEMTQSCTIASARVSFDVTSLDGNDDITVIVTAGGERGAWWLRLGPNSFEESGNLPLSGTYGYGAGEIQPDPSASTTSGPNAFPGLDSAGTWTIFAFEPERDNLHDFVLEDWSIEFDCLD